MEVLPLQGRVGVSIVNRFQCFRTSRETMRLRAWPPGFFFLKGLPLVGFHQRRKLKLPRWVAPLNQEPETMGLPSASRNQLNQPASSIG